ncbi:hypothetical protein GOBAR_AA06238 [Gossypium barbadense]|uniref:Transposase MuDR plant domain-containing protein n=1 Tax=Gossypium barbadense TaxID=3634 RepID=A0A2P5YFH4_GOSBA|nr:hypothetical protein GOBAR_AA06238 [Gossypium barbadense]
MVTLYSRNKSGHIELIQLFAELADVELVEVITTLSEEYEVQDPCTKIHPIYVDGEDGYDNNALSDHKVEDFIDLDLDEVSDDINDEGMNGDRNFYTSSFGNPSLGIVICNVIEAHMSIIDPNVAYASKFSKYLDILLTHQLTADLEREELFVGQKFMTNKDCPFAIKRYNVNVSIDYKVIVSKLILYIGECWRLAYLSLLA